MNLARSNSPHDGTPSPLDAAALAKLHALDPTGKAGVVTRVLRAYEHSLRATMPALGTAMEQGDSQELLRLAHTLKSSSASVGALALSALCAQFEAAARERQRDAWPSLLARVQAEGQQVLAALATAG